MADQKTEGTDSAAPGPPKGARITWFFVFILAVLIGFLGDWNIAKGLLVAIVGVWFAISFIVLPTHIWRTYRVSTTPEVREIDLDAPEARSGLAEGHRAMAEALGRLGFVDRGHYSVSGLATNQTMTVGYFENREECTTAEWTHVAVASMVLDPMPVS